MTDLLGKPRHRVHRCGNCILWSLAPNADMGVCEAHSGDGPDAPAPATFVPGMGLRDRKGQWQTTSDSFCDHQVPIPPPGPPCPECGTPTCDGFGLAGGGYGAYVYCPADGCNYFEKFQEFGEGDD